MLERKTLFWLAARIYLLAMRPVRHCRAEIFSDCRFVVRCSSNKNGRCLLRTYA